MLEYKHSYELNILATQFVCLNVRYILCRLIIIRIIFFNEVISKLKLMKVV